MIETKFDYIGSEIIISGKEQSELFENDLIPEEIAKLRKHETLCIFQ